MTARARAEGEPSDEVRGGRGMAEVFRARWAPSVRLATALVGDRSAAEDIVQDALLELSRRWDRIDNAEAYLRVAVVNRSRNHRRWLGNGRRRAIALTLTVDAPELDELWAVLARLSTRRRAAIVLRYYEDLTIDEIARLLDCRPGTVSSLLHRGLNDLREVLSDDE